MNHIDKHGPGSSVGIATELLAGRSGDRIQLGARFSVPVQTGPGAHPASCTMGTVSFPGVKSGRSVTLTPHTLLVPWSPMGRTACTEPQCLYKGAPCLPFIAINVLCVCFWRDSPPVGQGLLIHEFSRSRTMTHYSR